MSQHDGHTITRSPDGNITIEGPGVMQARIPKSGDFDENLAEVMPSSELKLLAMRLKEFSQVDIESREDWADREKEGMAMLGLTKQVMETSDEEDEEEEGHDTVNPMMMGAVTRFQANAIVELFPPNGPAETKVLGTQTPAKLARAARVRKFLNHYLVDDDEGYFNDTDKMLMYLPIGGSVFRRAAQDYTTGLPILRHVKATNFIAPYAGTDLPSMPRYAWSFTMTGEDIDRAMQIGMFVDLYLPQPAVGQAMHAQAADISDLRNPSMHERDRLYQMLEYHIDLEVLEDPQGAGARTLPAGDTGKRPYVVVVDISSDEVLMVRRNWRKKDPKHKKRLWFAHHQFLPGLGFYGWGYPHVIGSVQRAASGAQNALLDSAVAANFQGGFVSKEAKIAGEFRLEHGVWKQCDSSGEDLAKSFYTPPFKEPSPALFKLLEILVQSGERFTGNTDAAVGEGNNTGPVGTTIALIEQSQKPISAIHKRLHVSMSAELNMLCELIEDYMPSRYDYKIGDEQQFLLKSDFAPGVDILCVTDPGVTSDTQRVMRAQAVIELQEKEPQLYPPAQRAAAHRRMLVALKVPNIDEVGPLAKSPQYLDPIAENGNMLNGNPVQVFMTQDDQSHIKVHQDGLQRAQALYPKAEFDEKIMPAFQAHIRDHMAKAYMKSMYNAAGIQPRFDHDGNPVGIDPNTERQITGRVVGILASLPQPQPKPGSPSAEQQTSQAKVQAMKDEAQARIDTREQEFQAEEKRKQTAFENEERRKDQALLHQENRIDTAKVTDTIRTEVAHTQKIRHAHEKNTQALAHGSLNQDQRLEHGDAAHEQKLTQGAEGHEQGLEHSDTDHQVALKQADQLAKAAASEEAEADSHVKF